jgi:NitT/TauT family transport system permease protein
VITAGLLGAIVAVAAMILLARSDALSARIAVPVLFGAMLLWLWQTLVEGFAVPSVILPTPSAVAVAFFANLDTLGADFRQTVLRSVLPGYAIGCGAGFLIPTSSSAA